jgi:hypothetical protein
VQDTFSCPVPGQDLTNPLSSGYRALIAKDEKDFDPKDLWLDERGLHIKANGNPGNLLTGCDYLVFKIEKIPPPRDDWRVLQSLNAAWKKVEDTVSSCEGDKAAVDRAFNMFKWMVLGCGDLLVSDRKRIVAQQSDALATLWNAGTETHFGPLEVAPEIKELYKKDTIDAANIQVRLD